MAVEKFADDERGYRTWVTQHPRGYVLVSWNPPRPEYISVHRADCHCINPVKATRVKNWTHLYVKVCADTLPEIRDWADAAFGRDRHELQPCGHCKKAGRVPGGLKR
jgi:hypothetical protein